MNIMTRVKHKALFTNEITGWQINVTSQPWKHLDSWCMREFCVSP